MGVKGSAAGGGLSQCIPLTKYSLGFTGDINAVMNAHNLAMVALTSRMQHERNYSDQQLEKLSRMRRLNIDPTNVTMGWIIDFCCQELRNIITGIPGENGKSDGFMMHSRFDIAVASEVMAILAVARDLKDLRERMGRIIVAYDRDGKPVTTSDLEVAGAMTAWMVEAINPNLIQTIEGQPVLVHAGPFANIAIGQSSIIADRVALKLSDVHVTESGFGADIGYEKFWNLKCHYSGLTPDAAVIVATVRALKSHGGAPVPVPGRPLPEEYRTENVGFVEKGCCKPPAPHQYGEEVRGLPVVCINAFVTDTPAEIRKVRELCEAAGARVALSRHWELGGEGAVELAEAVLDACEEKTEFTPLYAWDLPFKERIERIATEVYGADGVEFLGDSLAKLEKMQQRPDAKDLGLCMVKTQYSLSDDPALKGVPGAGACASATCSSTGARATWSRWRARSRSCPAPAPTPPSAAWTWTPRPATCAASSKGQEQGHACGNHQRRGDAQGHPGRAGHGSGGHEGTTRQGPGPGHHPGGREPGLGELRHPEGGDGQGPWIPRNPGQPAGDHQRGGPARPHRKIQPGPGHPRHPGATPPAQTHQRDQGPLRHGPGQGRGRLPPHDLGRLLIGGEAVTFLPCTPAGIQEMIVRSGTQTKGAEVVVVGRSNIVGKPIAVMMGQKGPGANATVTMVHTGTRDLAAHCRRADILIVAAGQPGLVKPDWIKPGATVIDVGVNRVGVNEKTGKPILSGRRGLRGGQPGGGGRSPPCPAGSAP